MIGEASGGNYFSYHFDLRGSTVALSDASGTVTERIAYTPFGVLLDAVEHDTPFLFNGQYGVMTDANGLYHMRARFYSPELRRFVNQDILLGEAADGQSLNRYAFVTGNPISFIDPFGLAPEDVFDGIMSGVVGLVVGGAVAAVVVSTVPISGTAMVVIAVSGSAIGGFFTGVNGYEYFSGRDYWTGEGLSSSEIDYRLGQLIAGGGSLFIGCTWFRIPSRDPKALSDWEWLKLSPKQRGAYDNGLGTIRDDLYSQISHLPPQERGIDIRDTDWLNALKNAPTGPGPAGRFAWPLGHAGSQTCECYSSDYSQ